MEKDLFRSACLRDSLDASTQRLSEIQEEVLQHGGDEHEHRILVHEGERKVGMPNSATDTPTMSCMFIQQYATLPVSQRTGMSMQSLWKLGLNSRCYALIKHYYTKFY